MIYRSHRARLRGLMDQCYSMYICTPLFFSDYKGKGPTMYLKTFLLIVLSIGIVQPKGNVKVFLINLISQVQPPSTKNLNPMNPGRLCWDLENTFSKSAH